MDYKKIEHLVRKNSFKYEYDDRKHCEEAFNILHKVEKFIEEHGEKLNYIKVDTTSRVSSDIIYGTGEENKLFLGVSCYGIDGKHDAELTKVCFKSFLGFTHLNWKYMEMVHEQRKITDISMDDQGLLELTKLFIGADRCKTIEYEFLRQELNKSGSKKEDKKLKL